MGASLDTPLRCPLCNELTLQPVTLKCNHSFCRRCIGDLWSVSPNGPFCCPEWRCKTVYRTLPFDSGVIWPITSPSRRAQTPSTAGNSKNDDQSKFDSSLRRPSLTSRLLGKRKASTPAPQQPDTKRLNRESTTKTSNDTETPTSSLSDKPDDLIVVSAARKVGNKESTQSECVVGSSSSEHSDSNALNASDVSQYISIQETQHEPENVVILNDSDSSNEVDICDAPPLTAPKDNTQVTGIGVSTTRQAVHHDSKPPLIYTKHAASASGSPSRIGILARPENKRKRHVPCHYCPKALCKSAVKTCLVCGASMCAEHLIPHMESPVFQSHTLVSPMEDISLLRCQEHHEMNRIYCRQCAVCVCTVCTVIGSHRDHVCISIREAERELRGNLKEEIKQLQISEQQVKDSVSELTEKKETFGVVLSEARAGVKQQYGAIREALEVEEQSALQCVTKEESRVLGGLEEKLRHLNNSLQSIQHGLYTLEALSDAKGETQDQAFIIEYSKVAQLAGEMGSCMNQLEATEEVDQARMKCLQKWTEKRLDTVVITVPSKDRDLYTLLYGIVPLLDADTAHPKLQLSDNNRRVTYNEAQQAYTEQRTRFSSFPQVLSSRALESGRWYWEVSVSVADGRWKVALCEGQMERKSQKDSARLGFNLSSWCLACDRGKVEALHNKVSVPVAVDSLQRVGVFLDFEEGVLSFYNVTAGGSLALMHTFKHSFTDPLYPALSVSKTQLAICDLFQL